MIGSTLDSLLEEMGELRQVESAALDRIFPVGTALPFPGTCDPNTDFPGTTWINLSVDGVPLEHEHDIPIFYWQRTH